MPSLLCLITPAAINRLEGIMKQLNNTLAGQGISIDWPGLILALSSVARAGVKYSDFGTVDNDPIRLASTHGFGHEAALAAECAAIFHRNMKSSEATVTNYFSRSRELYVMWGATAKVSDLIHNMI